MTCCQKISKTADEAAGRVKAVVKCELSRQDSQPIVLGTARWKLLTCRRPQGEDYAKGCTALRDSDPAALVGTFAGTSPGYRETDHDESSEMR